jgi:cold shock CspA family protein
MPQATVKSYDSLTQTGVLISDDHETTYEIGPDAITKSMFRFLRPGQRVTFDQVERGGQTTIENLRIGLA